MKFTEPEWQIMNVLWEKGPATARDIAGALPENVNWAYTTIKTMLSRLVVKKALSEEKRGNTSVYTPLVSRSQARRSAVGNLLNQAFDGALTPLLSFLAEDRKLSDRQRDELRELLDRQDSRKTEE